MLDCAIVGAMSFDKCLKMCSFKHDSDKVLRQNGRIAHTVMPCFRRHLDFMIGFATKTSSHTLSPSWVFGASLIDFTKGLSPELK